MSKEALKQALEALENAEYGDYDKKELNEAISALREALAQEKPTAWVTAGPHTVPLVTQPVQPDNTSKLYEELRVLIDGGSESFTHKDAVQYLKDTLRQKEWTPEDMAYRPGGLEQPEQDPVAYLCENAVGHKYFRWKKPSGLYKPIALFASPSKREWVGLTDEERSEIYNRMDWVIDFDWEYELAIEAKLKEKNT